MKIGKTIPSAVSANCIPSAIQIPSLINTVHSCLCWMQIFLYTPVRQGQESGDAL